MFCGTAEMRTPVSSLGRHASYQSSFESSVGTADNLCCKSATTSQTCKHFGTYMIGVKHTIFFDPNWCSSPIVFIYSIARAWR